MQTILSQSQVEAIVKENQRSCRYKFRVVFSDGTKKKLRLFVGQGGYVCKFAKNSRTKGYAFPVVNITDVIPEIASVANDGDPTVFAKRCQKLIDILEQSRMWSNLLKEFKFLHSIGLEKAEEYSRACWEKDSSITVPSEFSRDAFSMVQEFKLVKMYFGKIYNDVHLDNIRRAVMNGQKLSFRLHADKSDGLSYDTSFEYDPDGRRGWYSLEYSNCGNGHYYLALSPTHAIFCEDD